MAALQSGQSMEEACALAISVGRESAAAYDASTALIVGALALVIALAAGGLAIIPVLLLLFAGVRGLKSATRRWQAIAGLVLGGIALLIFGAKLLR